MREVRRVRHPGATAHSRRRSGWLDPAAILIRREPGPAARLRVFPLPEPGRVARWGRRDGAWLPSDLRDPTLLGRDRRAGRGQPAAPPAGREPREDEDPDDEWRVYSDGVGGPSRPCEPRAVSKVESRNVRLDGSFASPWLAFSDNERDRLQPVVLCWKRDGDLCPARAPAKATHRVTMQAGRSLTLVGPWMSAVITVVCSSIGRILSARIA